MTPTELRTKLADNTRVSHEQIIYEVLKLQEELENCKNINALLREKLSKLKKEHSDE